MRNTRSSSSLAVVLAILLTAPVGFAECPGALPGDLDGDCDVDLADLAALLANYGQQWTGPASLEWNVQPEPVMSPPCNYPGAITVLYDDGVYKLWHDGGQTGQLEVMYSWSVDGFDWACSEHAYFPDSTNDAVPKVVKRCGAYYMWVGQTGGETSVDFTVSADGESWTHVGWVADWFHYDILPTESGFEAWFTLYDDASCYRYGTSEDGLNWTDHGCAMPAGSSGEYDEFLSYVNVIKVCDLYHMWYKCSTPNMYAYATSEDGMTWDKHGLLEGFEALPEGNCEAPAVLQEGNRLRGWFGKSGGTAGLSVYYAETYFTGLP